MNSRPSRKEEESMTLKKELLDVLACPVCKGGVEPVDAQKGLKCSACKVVYPVRNDIPIMLPDQSVPEEEWTGKA